MKTVLVGIQLMPNNQEDHTGGIVHSALETIKASGLRYQVGPLETVIEGDFKPVMQLIEDIHVKAVEEGADELLSNIKIHYRTTGVTFEDKQ